MASENEPAKLLLPYLQRADELQKHEPLVGYYCRLYAMERGLKIPQSERTKTTSAILVSLIKQLEKDKKSLQLAPDDHFHLEGFASNVFAKADKQDRTGRADLNTTKTFYAANIFFDILNQFGELQPDVLVFNLTESGLFCVLPWLTMPFSANLGGWIAETLVSKGMSVTTVRKVMQSIGFLGPAFFLS